MQKKLQLFVLTSLFIPHSLVADPLSFSPIFSFTEGVIHAFRDATRALGGVEQEIPDEMVDSPNFRPALSMRLASPESLARFNRDGGIASLAYSEGVLPGLLKSLRNPMELARAAITHADFRKGFVSPFVGTSDSFKMLADMSIKKGKIVYIVESPFGASVQNFTNYGPGTEWERLQVGIIPKEQVKQIYRVAGFDRQGRTILQLIANRKNGNLENYIAKKAGGGITKISPGSLFPNQRCYQDGGGGGSGWGPVRSRLFTPLTAMAAGTLENVGAPESAVGSIVAGGAVAELAYESYLGSGYTGSFGEYLNVAKTYTIDGAKNAWQVGRAGAGYVWNSPVKAIGGAGVFSILAYGGYRIASDHLHASRWRSTPHIGAWPGGESVQSRPRTYSEYFQESWNSWFYSSNEE